MYHLHPSDKLRSLFVARPFQGAEPERASFVFVGLDANYSPDIEHSAIFPQLLDYIADGVAFWQKRGVDRYSLASMSRTCSKRDLTKEQVPVVPPLGILRRTLRRVLRQV